MTTTHPDTRAAAGRMTLQILREMKKRREPIAMLTAYDHPTARILSTTGVELILVGDSAATTLLGAESTVAATLTFMLTITEAVRRGAPDAFLMADMPFASYPDIPTAVANAARFVREAGADAVKFEVDIRHVEMVRALTAAGIVTCTHIGLLPQRAGQQGGYIAQGRTPADAARLVETAALMAKAGAQMILLEAVPDEVTAEIQVQIAAPGGTGNAEVVVLGCGAGPSADGHVVVIHDMLGYNQRVPRFVEKFGDVPAAIDAAARRYVEAIKARQYPAARHGYRMKTN